MTTIPLSLSPDAEARFRGKASAVGEDVATYVKRLLERLAKGQPSLREISGPLADEFRRSGTSEDDLGEALDEAKRAARAQRRRPPGP